MISKEQEQEKKDKQTCLYDKHVELGALMSPFGGFVMPNAMCNTFLPTIFLMLLLVRFFMV